MVDAKLTSSFEGYSGVWIDLISVQLALMVHVAVLIKIYFLHKETPTKLHVSTFHGGSGIFITAPDVMLKGVSVQLYQLSSNAAAGISG